MISLLKLVLNILHKKQVLFLFLIFLGGYRSNLENEITTFSAWGGAERQTNWHWYSADYQ